VLAAPVLRKWIEGAIFELKKESFISRLSDSQKRAFITITFPRSVATTANYTDRRAWPRRSKENGRVVDDSRFQDGDERDGATKGALKG
jgi:hypothetical protein